LRSLGVTGNDEMNGISEVVLESTSPEIVRNAFGRTPKYISVYSMPLEAAPNNIHR
jgi:hypothetical protein